MVNTWLKPIDVKNISGKDHYFDSKNTDDNHFPELENVSLVLVGKDNLLCQSIRNYLRSLHNHFSNIMLVDGGNIQETTTEAFSSIINYFENKNIIVLFLDIDEVFISQIHSLIVNSNLHSVKSISNRLNILELAEGSIDHIAFQRHLISEEALTKLQKHSIDSMSLGRIRAETSAVEPIIRDTDILLFDLAAVRKSDVPASKYSTPSGLYTEEACQIMKYAGGGSNLKVVGIRSALQTDKDIFAEAALIAEMIWYFTEGLNENKKDHPLLHNDFKQVLVNSEDMENNFVFLRSELSGKWWLALDIDNQEDNSLSRYVACSHEEYLRSSNSDIPERLFKHLVE